MQNLLVQRSHLLACSIVAVLLFFPTFTKAQPRIGWEFSFGGARQDEAFSIQQTRDGGYITAGYTGGADEAYIPGYHGGVEDAYVVKLDPFGAMEWQTCLGGTQQEEVNSIIQTSDGGYCAAIRTESDDGEVLGYHGGLSDAWIVKLDAAGNILWSKAVGGSNFDDPLSIIQTSDGGYAFAGYTMSNDGDVSQNYGGEDAWVVKLGPKGDIEWSRTFGGSSRDRARSIVQMPDGGYTMVGLTMSRDHDLETRMGGGPMDGWIVRLDHAGNIEWQKTYGGDSTDYFSSLALAPDGGFIVAGTSYSDWSSVHNHGGSDGWIVKLDSTGDIQWQRSLGSPGNDVAWSVIPTTDNGYAIAGVAGSNGGDVFGFHGGAGDAWIVKLAANGNIVWQQCFGGSQDDHAYQVIQSRDGNFAFAGMASSRNGDIKKAYGSVDYWVVKVSLNSSVGTASSPSLSLQAGPVSAGILSARYELPFTSEATLEITNLLGIRIQYVTLGEEAGGSHSASLNVGELPAGVYYVILRASGRTEIAPFQVLQ